MTRDNQSPTLDERLASFADQALDGQVDDPSTIGSDPEMRALAETVLRLKHAFSKEELSQASVKRLREDVLVRWRDEQQAEPTWRKFIRLDWLTPNKRSRLTMTMAWAAMAVILIVAIPILFSSGPLAASAGSEAPIAPYIWVFLGLLVLVFFWLFRRKH